jgi:type II secretory pathway component PulK
MTRGRRRGFALLTVLWVLTAASAVSLAVALAGRESHAASRNRISATRAYWRAVGCAERARWAIDDVLQRATDGQVRDSVWRMLDRSVMNSVAPDTVCSVRIEAAGTRLDVNAADGSMLERLFDAAGMADAWELTASVQDWIDEDDAERPGGGESGWYRAAGRVRPRNGPLASPSELPLVRGFEQANLDSVIDVEAGRISIATAREPVLAALPGFTPGVRQFILDRRATMRQIRDLRELTDIVPRTDADSVIAHFPELARLASVDPDAWIVTATSWVGTPAVASVVEIRIVRAGDRAAVERRRVRL